MRDSTSPGLWKWDEGAWTATAVGDDRGVYAGALHRVSPDHIAEGGYGYFYLWSEVDCTYS